MIKTGRVPSVKRVKALCDELGLEFYIGPPRRSLDGIETSHDTQQELHVAEEDFAAALERLKLAVARASRKR